MHVCSSKARVCVCVCVCVCVQLKAFLRGPEQSLTFRDRDVVRAIKNRAWESPVMCSFTTQVHRKTVTVTKVRDAYYASMHLHWVAALSISERA